MKNEYRLVTFCVESQQLFSGEVGMVRSITLDFLGSVPELARADGWLGAGGLSASAVLLFSLVVPLSWKLVGYGFVRRGHMGRCRGRDYRCHCVCNPYWSDHLVALAYSRKSRYQSAKRRSSACR